MTNSMAKTCSISIFSEHGLCSVAEGNEGLGHVGGRRDIDALDDVSSADESNTGGVAAGVLRVVE
ncbi:hypothetical protein C2S51_032248 [Perilla frutescens var. frutescens]|nr:hypothetical protein C2S51_032248 [Perilla frutescens var. frutescens]